jgi:hypothetical protein
VTRPMLRVDFNEMLERNLVLLSVDDTTSDAEGQVVRLSDGLLVDIYDDDVDVLGRPDRLVASGAVERNRATGWSVRVKWCCRIDEAGIRHESQMRANGALGSRDSGRR